MNYYSEPGEVFDPLPVRKIRRVTGQPHGNKILSKVNLPKSTDPQRLIFIKKVMDEFNAGNIETIDEYIVETLATDCEIILKTMNKILIGPLALHTLLVSLFESFPNGIFRTSSTSVDEHGIVMVDFIFSGSKLFDLVFGQDDLTNFDVRGDSFDVDNLYVVNFDRDNPKLTSRQLLVESPDECKVYGSVMATLTSACKIGRIQVSWSTATSSRGLNNRQFK